MKLLSLLFLCGVALSAQTLNAPASGSGILQGSAGSSTTTVAFPGVNYQSPVTLSATAYITGAGNNGIANAAAACAALTTSMCIVEIPYNYPGTDQVAGFVKDFTSTGTSTYSANTVFQDERNGIARYMTNNGSFSYSNQQSFYSDQSIYSSPNSVNLFVRQYKDSILAGGCEWYLSGSSGCISNYEPNLVLGYNNTYGQHILRGATLQHNAPGDTLGESEVESSLGGLSSAGTDEGLEWKDILVQQGSGSNGTAEFQAAVTTGGTNVNTITLGSPSQASGTLGEGRWLYDANSTPLTNTAINVTVCSEGSSNPCLVTLGTAVSASTAIGTVSAPVTSLGSQTITPSLTTGSITNFSTSSLVCVADYANDPEMIFPSAVGASTLTLNFRRPHTAGFIISTGGLCGYVMEFNADRVISSTHPEIQLSGVFVSGTLRRVWMVISTPSSTTLQLAVNGKGSWHAVAGNSSWNGTSNNGATFWRAARVSAISTTSGLNSGIGGGSISLCDNNVPWSTSSIASEALGAAVEIAYGNINLVNYFGNFSGASGGLGINYNGILNDGSMLALNNSTPVRYYGLNGGNYGVPYGVQISGQILYALYSQYGGVYSDLDFGCPSNGCVNQYHKVLQMGDLSGGDSDSLYMNESTGEPFLTSNNGGFVFGFRKDGFELNLESSATAATSSTVGKIFLNNSHQVCVNDSSAVAYCASPGFNTTAVTLSPSTGVTSATCTSLTCDLNGGSVQVVAGTFTTGAFLTIGYSSSGLTVAPRTCSVSMNGGTTFVGLGHGTPSTTTVTVTSAVSIASATLNFDYSCRR